MSPWRAIPLALLLAVVVRVPFWIEALHTPVDGDTAIVGLIARHPGEGTTLWGQPYGSTLDAWVATPFVAIWGRRRSGACFLPLGSAAAPPSPSRATASRALCRRGAGRCPPPYFLLLSALRALYAHATALRPDRRAALPGGTSRIGRFPPARTLSSARPLLGARARLPSCPRVPWRRRASGSRSRARKAAAAGWALVPLAAAARPLDAGAPRPQRCGSFGSRPERDDSVAPASDAAASAWRCPRHLQCGRGGCGDFVLCRVGGEGPSLWNAARLAGRAVRGDRPCFPWRPAARRLPVFGALAPHTIGC